jgi:hypothetical protein
LSNNKIGSEGAKALAESLKLNEALLWIGIKDKQEWIIIT